MTQIPRAALVHHEQPYPPPNINMSKSYKYDMESNNPRLFDSYYYMVETFYVKAVISRVSCKLILNLPNHQLSPIFNEDDDDGTEKTSHSIELNVQRVLTEFKEFIEANRHTFSPLQDYTLEMYRLFYTICLGFLRSSLKGSSTQFSLYLRHIPKGLDLTDVNNILRLHRIVPDAILVIDRTFTYLSVSTADQE